MRSMAGLNPLRVLPVDRAGGRFRHAIFGIVVVCSPMLPALTGCDGAGRDAADARAEAAAFRDADADAVRRGERTFAMHCAVCHGEQRQGSERWWERDADGRFGPPALDGSAHAWHHPVWQLRDMIRYGSAVGVAGTEQLRGFMPPFSEVLDSDDIDALIAYIVTQWPEPVYDAWLEYQQRDSTRSAWEQRTGERWVSQERE